MGAITFSLDRTLIDELTSAIAFDVFVETGTFEGETVAEVRDVFAEIHSVELSDQYYELARLRFAEEDAIHIYHGESTDMLIDLRERLKDRAVLYWLDAHWCVAEGTAGERSQCPLLDELRAIGHLNDESVLLIDDARLFFSTPPVPHEVSDWPRFDDVLQALRNLSRSHEIAIVNDVIAVFPREARAAIDHYSRTSGIDWLDRLTLLAGLEAENVRLQTAADERLEAIHELTRALEEHRTAIELGPGDRETDSSLAELREELLAELDEALAELVERGEPLLPDEARRVHALAAGWLDGLDYHLLTRPHDLPQETHGFVHHRRAKLQAWLRPRIGLLSHYPPKPIRLPLSYLRATAPDPAPTISVVTPSYQQGQFLERTIASVLDQDYPALEYYVQDGGSSDGTIEILRRYDDLLSGWTSEPDGGQAMAINRGFASTTGEIMGWLNSDDLLLPGALAHVARYFATHPEVDVVYGNRLMIDANDEQIGAWILPGHDDAALTLADFVPQETLFWRRRIWDAAGARIDEDFAYALDWDLLLRFRTAGARMAHLPRYLGAFRVHDEQKTSATITVGMAEMARLREREHGRPVSIDEAIAGLQPFFRRHRVKHAWQRVLDRLPLPSAIHEVAERIAGSEHHRA
jgi:GT2 family glycosyltransferase